MPVPAATTPPAAAPAPTSGLAPAREPAWARPREPAQRVVLVTGGSRGIGAATVRRLAAAGYLPVFTYRQEAKTAQALVEALRMQGQVAHALACDVTLPGALEALFAQVDGIGPLVGLVNNAGILGTIARVDDLAQEDVSDVFACNVTAVFETSRLALRRLSTRHGGPGGSIVNLSSGAARTGGSVEMVLYASSKGAIDTFTLGLAREVAAEGVRVNAVAPGLIDTEIHARAGQPQRLTTLQSSIPMGRAGTADEVAQAIVWLLSDAASYVTGSILAVAGGR